MPLKALCYDRSLARIRQVLSFCSLDGAQFGFHSMSRGGASHCYAMGLSAESIKLIGILILNVSKRYFYCGSLLLLVLAVRILTLVHLSCE